MPALIGVFREAAIHRWEFERRGKKVEITAEGPLISNHQDIVVEAALARFRDPLCLRHRPRSRRGRAWRAQVRFDGMVDDAPRIVPLSPEPAFASSRASCLHQLPPGSILTD